MVANDTSGFVVPGDEGSGDEYPSGVDACKVANRSGVEVEAPGRLHPVVNNNKNIIPVGRKSIRRLDLFNIKFLTR